jgi:hypothetical protein
MPRFNDANVSVDSLTTIIARPHEQSAHLLHHTGCNHQSHLDTEEVLRDNLEGLSWLRKELKTPGSGGPKP